MIVGRRNQFILACILLSLLAHLRDFVTNEEGQTVLTQFVPSFLSYSDGQNSTIFLEHDNSTILLEHEDASYIPLEILTRSNEAQYVSCPSGLVPVLDTVNSRMESYPPGRRIPRIVHVTSKSRCVTPNVREHLKKWRFPGYAFYFHDDEAAERLLDQDWVDQTFRTGRWPNETSPCTWEHAYTPDTPPRDVINKCVTVGATKADLWRYAVLYRYGGIYSDIDNSPTKFNGETIQDDHDFFAVLEKLGIIGQYFLASSPHHPFMRYAMNDALDHLRQTVNVMNNIPERNTGPGAVKRGFCFFMEAVNKTHSGYVTAGRYVGDQNRSITVVGHKQKSNEYINRYGLGEEKQHYYKSSNISHFNTKKALPRKGAISCEQHLQQFQGVSKKVANYRFDHTAQKYVDA